MFDNIIKFIMSSTLSQLFIEQEGAVINQTALYCSPLISFTFSPLGEKNFILLPHFIQMLQHNKEFVRWRCKGKLIGGKG